MNTQPPEDTMTDDKPAQAKPGPRPRKPAQSAPTQDKSWPPKTIEHK